MVTLRGTFQMTSQPTTCVVCISLSIQPLIKSVVCCVSPCEVSHAPQFYMAIFCSRTRMVFRRLKPFSASSQTWKFVLRTALKIGQFIGLCLYSSEVYDSVFQNYTIRTALRFLKGLCVIPQSGWLQITNFINLRYLHQPPCHVFASLTLKLVLSSVKKKCYV